MRLRLRADVPVGAYLSGGLDSSAITALIHSCSDMRLETFSIAFTDAGCTTNVSTRRKWRGIWERGHHVVMCEHGDIGRVFPEVIWHTEMPIMRTSPAPLFLLSQLVRQHQFKVVLTGEGADEFLAGYNIFKEAKVRRFWAGNRIRPVAALLLQKLYPYVGDLSSVSGRLSAEVLRPGLQDTGRATYSHDVRWRNNSRTKRLFSPSLHRGWKPARRTSRAGDYLDGRFAFPEEFRRWSSLGRSQYLEAKIFLAEYLLCSQGDRMAMAHASKGAFPFLDHRVIEFCNGLRPRLKLCGLNEK